MAVCKDIVIMDQIRKFKRKYQKNVHNTYIGEEVSINFLWISCIDLAAKSQRKFLIDITVYIELNNERSYYYKNK